ncbi:uncharacterized protein [Choristoneura fumiferana]|uniref:uncharacterized protein n=1 Tax=Choristoneura fumiferana TaxID=7141 RepID=UPI003D15A45E
MPSLNPARSLGPAFVLSRWESHWVSWVGGLGGGAACALLHEWGSKRPRGSSRASSPRDLDDVDKPAFSTHYRHAPTYCAASARAPTTRSHCIRAPSRCTAARRRPQGTRFTGQQAGPHAYM